MLEENLEMSLQETVYQPTQEKTVVPDWKPVEVTPDKGYALSKVNVEGMPEPTETETFTENGTYDVSRIGTAVVDVDINLQDKTVTPTEQTQTVEADAGYDGLDAVTVNPIPPEYVVPSGSVDITANGQVSVSGKATAVVNVPGIIPTGTKQINITENGTKIEDVTDYAGAEIIVEVPVGVPNGEIVRMTYYEVVVGENTIATSGELKAYIDAAIGRTDAPVLASVRKKDSYLQYEFLGVRPVNVGLRYNRGGMDTFSYTGANNSVNIPDGSIIDLYFLSWSLED